MKKLNILVKDRNDQTVTVYVDSKEVGVIADTMEIPLGDGPHSIQLKYGDKMSRVLKLKKNEKEYFVEINKQSKVIYASPLAFIRILVLLLVTSFCFHKALGIGYYFFAFAIVLTSIAMYLNWNKLVVTEVKGS